jgi:signal transduction histidine kinase
VLALIALVGFLALQIRSLQSSADWVDHTDIVIARMNGLLRSMIDEETGLRGYLLTGQQEFLEPYVSGRVQMDREFAGLKKLVSDDPPQEALLKVLEQEKDGWAEVATRRLNTSKSPQQLLAEALDAKHRMDHIRLLAAQFTNQEEILRNKRTSHSRLLSGIVLSMLIVIAAAAAGGILYYTARIEQSRAKLRRRSSEMEALLAALPVGVIISDPDGKLLNSNVAADTIWGATVPLIELWQYHEFRGCWPGTQDALKSEDWGLARALKTGDSCIDEEVDIVAFDGTQKTILNSAVPILDSERRIVGGVVVNVDITERKQAEQVMVRAEKLSVIGRLASSMAHEINNPLAAALNSLYLVTLDSTLGEATSEYLDIARRELERVSHITKQTLGFYRESGKPAKADVRKIADSVLEVYAPKLKNKQINVERRYPATALVFTNEGELRQMISNLLGNSIDAVSQQGRIRLRLNAHTLANNRPAIRLMLSDNGCGIEPEHLKKVFEPFFSTKETTGTGLGLWITLQLVKKHHGRIRARSMPGVGTAFEILLPTDRRNEEQPTRDLETTA